MSYVAKQLPEEYAVVKVINEKGSGKDVKEEVGRMLKTRRSQILSIFDDLSGYCQEHKVISEGELALKIRECVNSLSDTEREELERKSGGNLEELIFKSITSEDKISVFSPDMRTRINYQGEIFYCLPTHRYMGEELEEAFLRWAKIRSPLSALNSVVTDFMAQSGYQIKNREHKNEYLEMLALKNKNKHRSIHIFVFPSIKFVPYFVGEKQVLSEKSKAGEEKVIVVSTEKTPAPFISFFREQDIGDAMVWVADVEKKTIDPFIGNPEDEEIENNFANPEQARRAVSVWMRKMHFLEL